MGISFFYKDCKFRKPRQINLNFFLIFILSNYSGIHTQNEIKFGFLFSPPGYILSKKPSTDRYLAADPTINIHDSIGNYFS